MTSITSSYIYFKLSLIPVRI